MRPLPGAAALLLSTTCLAVHAQAVYRCGDSYSQQPCAGGQQLPQAPLPNPSDRAQAGANARRDATLAAGLEKDRLRQDSAAGSQPLYIPPPAGESPFEEHKSPEKSATRKLDLFTASVPGSGKKKKEKDDKPKAKASAKAAPKDGGKTKVAKAPTARTVQVGKPAKPAGSS